MCIEDIRLGRKTKTQTHKFVTDVTPKLMVDGELTRVVLILSPSPGETYTIGPNPNLAAGEGIVIGDKNMGYVLHIKDVGDFITKPLYCLGTTGGVSVGWVEGLLDDQ